MVKLNLDKEKRTMGFLAYVSNIHGITDLYCSFLLRQAMDLDFLLEKAIMQAWSVERGAGISYPNFFFFPITMARETYYRG
jgi:hypothetical protein